MIRELYFEKKDRIVKKDGKLRFNGKTHYILHNFWNCVFIKWNI